jgi:hypothetical protein
MGRENRHESTKALQDFLRRLLRDRSGNAMPLLAAALVPVLAMIGGGIDMGRSYLSQSRLQQACDAGVLAARKKLGSTVATPGTIPSNVAATGNSFFNVNFRDGAYGTENRGFEMTLEEDYSISGVAAATVPTSVMKVFGFSQVDLQVECTARLNFSNTDVMMVLDTTGSMNEENPGDSITKIDALRGVVRSFHTQLEASKAAGTRIRYGFVPYSSNVNVGSLLKSGWLVDRWTYQGRESVPTTGTGETVTTYTPVSGSNSGIPEYLASSCPSSTVVWTTISTSTLPNGDEIGQGGANGYQYQCFVADLGKVRVTGTHYVNYVYNWLTSAANRIWEYKPIEVDVSTLKDSDPDKPLVGGSIKLPMGNEAFDPTDMEEWFSGCIEERGTYEITDFSNVDLSRALDLDIDLVPTEGQPETQWRPLLHNYSFERSIDWDSNGSFTPGVVQYKWDYLNAGWAGFSACPAAARKLAEISSGELDSYLDTLQPDGSTYHDIGMIWGGRLLSPTGLFADDNVDVDGKATSRHLIFLTDGETSPLDLTYGTYGIEPLDQRRWSPSSPLTLTQTVENRFGVACNEVRKRNITVWVVSFGVSLNPMLSECAGPGHAFEAADAAQLTDVFSKIAASMGDLRISK